MKIHLSWRLVLAASVLCAATGLSVTAQAATNTVKTGRYYVKLTAPALDTPEAEALRKQSVIRSAAYWDNLYNVGKVSILGAAKDGSTSFGMVILEGVSESEATSLANSDPSVKAGVTTVQVLPLQVFQEKGQTRPKAVR